jgi:hypothetical protein
VDVTGNLTSTETGIPNTQIFLSYSVNAGNSWINLAAANTDANGNFAAIWNPQANSNSLLKATYPGSMNYSSSDNTISLTAMQSQEQNVISVVSNSTITSLFFNSTSNQLFFSTNGTSGTTGYAENYLPKSLVSDISNLKAYLDDTPLKYNASTEDNSWLISFTFNQSSHQVTINLGSATSQNGNQLEQLFIIGIVASIIIVVAGLLTIRKRRKERQIVLL